MTGNPRSDAEIRQVADEGTREGNVALWTALLTLEGIILSIFGAAAVLKSAFVRGLVSFIVVLAFIGGTLMLLNFIETRNFYRALGRRTPEEAAELENLTEDQFRQRAAKTAAKGLRGHDARNRRETWTIRLLTLQALAILALIWIS